MSRNSDALCVVAALMVGSLTAACTSTSAGAPRPQDGASTSATSEPGGTPRPSRPRELRLDGKDPCALIPPADRAKFYIERPGVPGESKVFNSPNCSYSTDVGGFRISLIVTEGIGKWTDGSRIAEAKEVAPVAGFPALSITVAADKHGCDVVVDVAQGQYLMAAATVTSSKESQVPERCEYAHQLAESAMRTLVSA